CTLLRYHPPSHTANVYTLVTSQDFSPYSLSISSFCFFFNDTATTEIYTLSLHDALPISSVRTIAGWSSVAWMTPSSLRAESASRSEEHTSELQSRVDLVCRLLLEKKKKKKKKDRENKVMNGSLHRCHVRMK